MFSVDPVKVVDEIEIVLHCGSGEGRFTHLLALQKEQIFGKGEKGISSPESRIGLYLGHTLTKQYGGVWAEDNDPTSAEFVVEPPTYMYIDTGPDTTKTQENVIS
ncbi:hypothetical protein [Natrinema halophilum]|uniref:hypothetical protein n=1 Tax=Natrinema halophilum TaxID=1699371 RepID=UPI001F383895|nr:hypothetical protein [Natrinema halophilum]UHQ96350.1 hypothetical protein HYG82_22080 [Natrinema halophilum]